MRPRDPDSRRGSVDAVSLLDDVARDVRRSRVPAVGVDSRYAFELFSTSPGKFRYTDIDAHNDSCWPPVPYAHRPSFIPRIECDGMVEDVGLVRYRRRGVPARVSRRSGSIRPVDILRFVSRPLLTKLSAKTVQHYAQRGLGRCAGLHVVG